MSPSSMEVIRRYVDREITAEEAADALGPGTAVVDMILAAKQLFGRLPNQDDAFTQGEYERAMRLLRLPASRPCEPRSKQADPQALQG